MSRARGRGCKVQRMPDDQDVGCPGGRSHSESVAVVRCASRRVGRFGGLLAESHRLGVPPGDIEAPWSYCFQRRAAQLYSTSLPTHCMRDLATLFGSAALCMAELSAPWGSGRSWNIVQSHLWVVSEVLDDAIGPGADRSLKLDERIPSTLPIAELGALVTAAGALALEAAGANVDAALKNQSGCPLGASEIGWVAALAEGARVIDIACDAGYSEREMFRKLRSIWRQIGASSRSEAILVATRRGWL